MQHISAESYNNKLRVISSFLHYLQVLVQNEMHLYYQENDVIPGSRNPDHIQENTELYEFELSQEEMEQMNALDRNEKHD